MADQEEEDLKMAIKMSMMQSSPPPEPKRSKPRDDDTRRLQRELMAAAAEKRMARSSPSPSLSPASSPLKPVVVGSTVASGSGGKVSESVVVVRERMRRELGDEEASQLFSMVFGFGVSKDILAQWCNQGIRFSPDRETSIGLVQHEGGPCGVLAAIQAFVLKHLLFFPDEPGKIQAKVPQGLSSGIQSGSRRVAWSFFNYFTEVDDHERMLHQRYRALVKSMVEILFSCGNQQRAVVALIDGIDQQADGPGRDEVIGKALEGLSLESASDMQKLLRVETFTSHASSLQRLEAVLPIFQSRMGALLFLISALLSRGLESVQADRDDPSLPLVTAPFGHASQEIVNLLLCGQAVANVFDGRMDLGGGMFLRGIPTNVEVGFLTLLESLNFCKVGQNLKHPKWPIWVVGSESHYTVLFALDTAVQDENEFEERESQIHRAFDAQDQSGGGGFISVEGFHQVLRETSIRLPPEKLDLLCSTGFIVWSEFWQVILDLDKSFGGLKDSSGLMGKKVFELYHFNGIAKSDLNGGNTNPGNETPVQRPRLTKLKVSVPPKWTPEEFMSDVAMSSSLAGNDGEVSKPEPTQHAPLVDCVRTRWPRATCNWVGDPPSIV